MIFLPWFSRKDFRVPFSSRISRVLVGLRKSGFLSPPQIYVSSLLFPWLRLARDALVAEALGPDVAADAGGGRLDLDMADQGGGHNGLEAAVPGVQGGHSGFPPKGCRMFCALRHPWLLDVTLGGGRVARSRSQVIEYSYKKKLSRNSRDDPSSQV